MKILALLMLAAIISVALYGMVGVITGLATIACDMLPKKRRIVKTRCKKVKQKIMKKAKKKGTK